jgi:methionyl-tRNA synthetase
MQKILITSALPYANGPLHFGHIAGAYLPADCYARFNRLLKHDVLYICGSDEYGIAITLSAEQAGRTPQQHVDLYHELNRKFFETLNISFDHYSRTTWQGHTPVAQQFFQDLLENGYIEERSTDQLYSETDQKFLADRYVVGTCPRCGYEQARGDECQKCGASYEATDLLQPRSKISGAPLTHKKTTHWFLLLEKFREKLLQWLEAKEWKPNVLNFVKGYIQEMHARAITRDMSWGIPVPLPQAEGKVLYVWFDAPIGYISATMEWAQTVLQSDLWKKYWLDPSTKLVHFIGKDNIPFHAVTFPAMVMGQNQPYKLVDELPANEFYNLEGRQFSKSEGWYIDLEKFFEKYTTDQIRYTIAANAPETADSEFTWKDFQLRCNVELLGKLGNFVHRVLVFAVARCGGKVPEAPELGPADQEFLASVRRHADLAKEAYSVFRVRRASQLLIELAQLGNVYFDAKRPWKDAKQPETAKAMELTIFCCLECVKSLALLSFPIIPATANKIWAMLGYGQPLEEYGWERICREIIPSGQQLREPQLLFQKVEDAQIEEEVHKLKMMVQNTEKKVAEKEQVPTEQAPVAVAYEPLKELIEIGDVAKLDLRTATILSVEPVPKSKKLYQIQVDLGFEKRTILSGIKLNYTPEQLLGKKIIVVANLKPATMMGIQSNGMLLAGSQGELLELVTYEQLPNGSIVK